MPKTFSTDLIYGQQKIMQTIRLVRLDSGRYATKYHFKWYRLLFLTFVIIEEMAFLHLNLFIPSFTPSLQTNS